jgi:CheY-like chemotaxis protein
MPLTVVLAVGLDAWQLTTQSPIWKAAGYIAVSAGSIIEAIESFKAGDFDLVLIGHSIPVESKMQLAHMIRATGARTPVVSIEHPPFVSDQFADATIHSDAGALLAGMKKLVSEKRKPARAPMANMDLRAS